MGLQGAALCRARRARCGLLKLFDRRPKGVVDIGRSREGRNWVEEWMYKMGEGSGEA